MSEYERALEAQASGNWKQALQLVKQGAKTFCVKCMWWLSLLYRFGLWVKRDEHKSKEWTKRGMVMGYSRCLYEYAIHNGKNDDHRYKEFEWWKDYTFGCASTDPYTKAMCYTGIIATQNDELFFRNMLPFEDDPFVAFQIGCYYQDCLDNTHCAIQFYLLAAQQGFGVAQLRLANILREQENESEAVVWYRKAAEQKYFNAKYNLAVLFIQMRNYAAALFWVKSGITGGDGAFQILYQVHEFRFKRIESCQSACLHLLAVRKFNKTFLSVLPVDVVRLITKTLWKTRDDEEWN